MKTVVVIGGGITGLTAMYEMQKLKKERQLDLDLILLEKEEELGGKIRTVQDGGFIMETGADSIVARHESVMPLIENLGLQEQLVYNATGISYLYVNDKLHAIPEDTIFGIPMSEEALFSSTLVSEEGKRTALKDYETRNDSFTRDSSIGEFLEAFLGKELVQKQIAPVLSGVYSGKLNDLTIASTLPYLLDYKNEYGSILKGLAQNKAKFKASATKKFISFEGGMATLINRLADELNESTILTSVEPESVTRRDEKYEISFRDREAVFADVVVLAVPHQSARHLLGEQPLNAEFDKLKNSSLISVYLGFDIEDEQLPADGTGFIVAENSGLKCDACTWSSRKWTHTSAERKLLVRLFYKSSNPSYGELKQMTEEELVQVALRDVAKSLNINSVPETVQVTDWKGLMPNYHLEHGKAVQALKKKMENYVPNVLLAGASYFGVGIGACIQNGKDTATMIAEKLIKEN